MVCNAKLCAMLNVEKEVPGRPNHSSSPCPSSTEEIHENRALCDKFLKFGIVLAIGMLISKTTAYRLSCPPGDRYAHNPLWPPSNSYIVISQLLFTVWYSIVALYLDCDGQGILI